MKRAIEFFSNQLRGIRHGEISPAVIDTIRVDAYDQKLPISQLAWTASKGGRILVTPHDGHLLGAIDNALQREGFSSYVFSKTQVVVALPPRSAEDRERVITQVNKLAEETRVVVRNIRKKIRQKTDSKDLDKPLQQLTDEVVEEINLLTKNKIEAL